MEKNKKIEGFSNSWLDLHYERNKNGQAELIKSLILGGIGVLIMCLFLGYMNGWGCKTKALFDKDIYCYQISYDNRTNALLEWVQGSHKQDQINAENQARIVEEARRQQEAAAKCYKEGKDYNYSFDIIENYNLSCIKVAYINDHFIDKTRQVDGGYISGGSSGIFVGLFGVGVSSGHVEGHLYQYVTERVLATGTLVQNIQYHLDCNEVKSKEVIDYYTESEFVMYYVDKCL